jgi:hypothetical protein
MKGKFGFNPLKIAQDYAGNRQLRTIHYSPGTLKKAVLASNEVAYKYEKPGREVLLRLQPDSLAGMDAINRVSYPELFAQSCNERGKVENQHKIGDVWRPSCSFSVLSLKCPDGHLINKAIYCGREWCATCGKKNSTVHLRRVGRWSPKLKQIDSLGYMVITIPAEIREHFLSKHDLNNFRTYIRRKFKREKISENGFIRYHFAGDCKKCKGKKHLVDHCRECNGTGSDFTFHPHLNILFAGGFIEQSVLKQFKADLAQWFKEYTGKEVVANLHYNYTNNEGKKKHRLRYVCRATWKIWDKKICGIINSYRVGATFGKWKKEEIETAMEATEKNYCPICLKADGVIHKLKKVNLTAGIKFDWKSQIEITPGIYFVQPQKPPN